MKKISIVTLLFIIVLKSGCEQQNVKPPSESKHFTPVITSPWRRIVEYPDHHLNDFCVFLDLQGIWHVMGIMGTGTWDSEQSFFHCSSPTLFGPYTKHSPLLTKNPVAETGKTENLSPQKHAPHVIIKDGIYHMFYRRPSGTILHLSTGDPQQWIGLGEIVFECKDARDICLIKDKNIFLMYYCQYENIKGKNRSCIFLRRSADLWKWSDPVLVYYDSEHVDNHSRLESPFVVVRPEGYYLFFRHRLMEEKQITIVLFSIQPDQFPIGRNTWISELEFVHAPEIVDYNGQYYILKVCSSGGTQKWGQLQGGLEVASLEFRKD